jgi:hypothetical protein
VSLLLNVGVLSRHTATPDRYLFAIPNAGPVVKAIVAGRKVGGCSEAANNLVRRCQV